MNTYTGILHTHSTFSYDGKVSIIELKEELKKAGISFACMTEHTDELTPEKATEFVTECRRLSDETFVFVPGFEVPYKDAHILMIGSMIFHGQFADEVILKKWKTTSEFVILAHPVRNKFIVDDTMKEVLNGIEIWNQQYDGKRVPRTTSYKLLVDLRAERPELLATGGLDLHRLEHLTFPRTKVMTDHLSEQHIIAALKNGECSFGHEGLHVSARADWPDAYSLKNRWQSLVSTFVVEAGKNTNAALAVTGLSLPKSLRKKIRSMV